MERNLWECHGQVRDVLSDPKAEESKVKNAKRFPCKTLLHVLLHSFTCKILLHGKAKSQEAWPAKKNLLAGTLHTDELDMLVATGVSSRSMESLSHAPPHVCRRGGGESSATTGNLDRILVAV